MKNGVDTTEIQTNVKKIGEEISVLEEQEKELNEKEKAEVYSTSAFSFACQIFIYVLHLTAHFFGGKV